MIIIYIFWTRASFTIARKQCVMSTLELENASSPIIFNARSQRERERETHENSVLNFTRTLSQVLFHHYYSNHYHSPDYGMAFGSSLTWWMGS